MPAPHLPLPAFDVVGGFTGTGAGLGAVAMNTGAVGFGVVVVVGADDATALEAADASRLGCGATLSVGAALSVGSALATGSPVVSVRPAWPSSDPSTVVDAGGTGGAVVSGFAAPVAGGGASAGMGLQAVAMPAAPPMLARTAAMAWKESVLDMSYSRAVKA